METNLQGRLRNTSLPYRNGLLALFEAVVNSIHAIEEAGLPATDGKITIDVLRDAQTTFQLESGSKKRGTDGKSDIVGFKITDNGIGFNDKNMDSFLTLDSEYKSDKGGRGVGRLLWLKAFHSAKITSVFENGKGKPKVRTLSFTPELGVCKKRTKDSPNEKRTTSVHLEGFKRRYREASPKTLRVIASNLLEHCLWYFVRDGNRPTIVINDGGDSANLDTIYDDQIETVATADTLMVKNVSFELLHVKLRSVLSKTHTIAFCAANRVVKCESINGKVPGLFGNLRDKTGEFVYECYLSSPFLDARVRSERTGFDIEEKPLDLFASTEISQQDIRDGVVTKIAEHLSTYLNENKKRGQERVNTFVSRKAPRYRPILSRIPEDQLSVDPSISDKELDLVLHKQLSRIEGELIADGHEVMTPKEDESYSDYRDRLQEYLRTVEDIKKSDLVNYVTHRKIILDLIETAINRKEDGKYEREEMIHSLIMPLRCDSTEIPIDGCNLWLVDERLAFHDYLASDKTLASMPITNSTETKEPDILALNVFDEPILVSDGTNMPLASIVVIELKRPMRDDAAEGEEKDPVEQALGYLDRVRQGKVSSYAGRIIPGSENIPGFCYILCDITHSVKKRLKMHDGVMTSDGLGYFFYKKSYNAYVEVISFNRLINSAKERNRAFFDKLGLPTT